MGQRFVARSCWPTGRAALLTLALFLLIATPGGAQVFQLPTANHSLFEPGGGERFFVGTVGRDWRSGMYGCVRSGGAQMHEGIDIRCLRRDKQGEPLDPVMAVADGTVAYVNTRPALSNYGNYLLLRHAIEGLEVYSTYAHLRSIRQGLRAGQKVKAGEFIATMGRTSNTASGISKERAHLHFELGFLCNDRFPDWYQKTFPGQRNDHGQWNGQNLLGLDPYLLFTVQRMQGAGFSLLALVREQTELCRVLVRDTRFPWLKRCLPLVRRNPRADREGMAGFEIALNYHGLPFQLIPRAPSEMRGQARYQLLSVNEPEYSQHPCRKLVVHKNGRWELAPKGVQLLELLTY